MYITCPRCRTSFVVLPEQIGLVGRKVRCSKCHNLWHQRLSEEQKASILAAVDKDKIVSLRPSYVQPSYSPGVNLPALLPVKIPEYLYVLPVLLVTLIIILSMVLFLDIGGLNSVEQNKRLRIGDVHMFHDMRDHKMSVNYSVMNDSGSGLAMPLVRIRLFNKSGEQIKSHIDDHSAIILGSKQYVRIKTSFSSISDNCAKIDVTLGNKLDFMLR